MATSPSVMAREAGTSAPTSRPARRRPSLSHLAIVGAAVLAFALNLLALQSRDATVEVALADRAIAPGTVLTASLVRLVPLRSDFEGLAGLVTADQLASVEGRLIGEAVEEGELIHRSTLVRPGAGDGLRTMSIPVPVEHAAGGSLAPGDRVDVISIGEGAPRFIATDLEVSEVAETVPSGLAGVGPYYVVVAVTAEEALGLAGAIETGSIEVVRSTGAAPMTNGSD